MGLWAEPSKKLLRYHDNWVASLSGDCREIANVFRPWKLYKIKSTGQLVYPLSIDEDYDGSFFLRVIVDKRFNAIFKTFGVFGISPENLEDAECPYGATIAIMDLEDEESPYGATLELTFLED